MNKFLVSKVHFEISEIMDDCLNSCIRPENILIKNKMHSESVLACIKAVYLRNSEVWQWHNLRNNVHLCSYTESAPHYPFKKEIGSCRVYYYNTYFCLTFHERMG